MTQDRGGIPDSHNVLGSVFLSAISFGGGVSLLFYVLSEVRADVIGTRSAWFRFSSVRDFTVDDLVFRDFKIDSSGLSHVLTRLERSVLGVRLGFVRDLVEKDEIFVHKVIITTNLVTAIEVDRTGVRLRVDSGI